MEKLPTKNSYNIRIVTNILTKALKLWLKSQVSQVSQLEVEIKASDGQILSGCIPRVSITASDAVYQGLNITRIQLAAENIQVNIGSILKGKQLKLLQTVPVFGDLVVDEQDLNSSLSSELLSRALGEAMLKILPEPCLTLNNLSWQKIRLDENQIILNTILSSGSQPQSLEIYLNLNLISNHEIKLENIHVMENEVPLLQHEHGDTLDLGSDVDIQELSLLPGQLVCRGRINVNP